MSEITDFRSVRTDSAKKKKLSQALKLFKNIFSLMGEVQIRLFKSEMMKKCN